MKKLLALVLCLGLFGACAAPVVPEGPEPIAETATETANVTEPTTLPVHPLGIEWDAPEAYWPVLDEWYEMMWLLRLNRQDAIRWNLIELGYFPAGAMDVGNWGFAVEDINSDGVPELFLLTMGRFPVSGDWGDEDGEWESRPHMTAIYTLFNISQPVQIANWSHRCQRNLTADGTLFWSTPRGAGGRSMSSSILESGALHFTELTYHYIRFYSDEHNTWQYRNTDSEGERGITWDELRTLEERYQRPTNPMPFNFISIEQ